MPIRRRYQSQLEELSNDYIRLGAMAMGIADKAFAAINTGERALAHEAIEGLAPITKLQRSIEERCLSVLVCEQPVARQMRQIVSILRMVSDLERVGAKAADIAKIGLQLPATPPPNLTDTRKMGAASREMLEDSIKAFISGSVVLADYVTRRRDIVDSYYTSLRSELALFAAEHPGEVNTIMDYLIVIHNINSISQYAVNISGWTKFYRSGIR